MSIVNLNKRITTNFSEYSNCSKSSDSLIYIEGDYSTDESGPDCLSLTVGNCWYDKNRYISIDPKKGIKIRPHAGIVIETSEIIALPFNIYGVLFGAGSNIYRASFVSNGKIDPGFCGKLRIGYHNASSNTITLKTGDKLAYAFFLTSESEISPTTLPSLSATPTPAPALGFWKLFGRAVKQNIFQIISSIIAIVSLIVSIIKY